MSVTKRVIDIGYTYVFIEYKRTKRQDPTSLMARVPSQDDFPNFSEKSLRPCKKKTAGESWYWNGHMNEH